LGSLWPMDLKTINNTAKIVSIYLRYCFWNVFTSNIKDILSMIFYEWTLTTSTQLYQKICKAEADKKRPNNGSMAGLMQWKARMDFLHFPPILEAWRWRLWH
jgi:hypothetical protein